MDLDKEFPGKYLKSSQLNGEMTLTMRHVSIVEFEDKPGELKRRLQIRFDEVTPLLLVIPTNRKTIQKMYGSETDAWIGKKITLYVKKDVEFNGELVHGLRVKPGTPQEATPADTDKFLSSMSRLKKTIGDKTYMRILSLNGYTSANEIKSRSDQIKVYSELQVAEEEQRKTDSGVPF